jgi:hypothetical protein
MEGPERGHTFGSVSRVDVARVVPILSADMGTYARQSLQERERGRRGHGGCEKVACD